MIRISGTSFATRNHNALPLHASLPRSRSRLSRAPKSRFTDHDVVAALTMLDLGIRQERIARAMGCTEHTLRQWDAGITRAHIRNSMEWRS